MVKVSKLKWVVGVALCAGTLPSCTTSNKQNLEATKVELDRTSVAIERLGSVCKNTLQAAIVAPSFKNTRAPAVDTVERIIADIRVGFSGENKDLFEGVYQLTEGITTAFLVGAELDNYFSSPGNVNLSRDFKASTVDTLYNGVCIDALQTIQALKTSSKPRLPALPAKRFKPSFQLDYKAVEDVGMKCEAINKSGAYARSFKSLSRKLSLRETQNLGIIFAEAQKAIRSDDPREAILGVAMGKQTDELLSFQHQFSQFLMEAGKQQLPTEGLATGVASRVFSRCQDNLKQALVLFKVNEQPRLPAVAIVEKDKNPSAQNESAVQNAAASTKL